jgi:hypothetical protein
MTPPAKTHKHKKINFKYQGAHRQTQKEVKARDTGDYYFRRKETSESSKTE